MHYSPEIVIKNVLYVLYSKKAVQKIEIDLLKKCIQEMGLKQTVFKSYYDEWKTDHSGLLKDRGDAENRAVLAFMIVSAYFNRVIEPEEKQAMQQFCEMTGCEFNRVKLILSAVVIPDFSNGVIPVAEKVYAQLTNDSTHSVSIKTSLNHPALYVASQVSKEGIDELQSLYICDRLGLNAALSGPPGVGKTQSILEIAQILDKKVFTKTCSSRTTESHIISHPVLIEKNGVTITDHENGPLCQAMEHGSIFYGDEYNLLKEDVQKRMNSAFDDRKYIDRNDGTQIRAQLGFFPVISYNPSSSLSRRDLEDSVADRFIHFYYREWTSDFKAYVSMKKSYHKINRKSLDYGDFGIELETRGIDPDHGFFIHTEDKGWLDFFTHQPIPIEPRYIYHAYRVKHLNSFDPDTLKAIRNLSNHSWSEKDLPRIFARFTELVNDLALTGKSSMLKKLGLGNINEKDQMDLLMVHKSSTRIITAALLHYHYFINKGWKSYLAQSYATSLIIDQITYGSYRNMEIGDMTNYKLLHEIAKAMSLYADNTQYNTTLVKESLL